MNLFLRYSSVLLLSIILISCQAEIVPDYDREQNIKDQILDYIIDADLVTLQSSIGNEFILMENLNSNSSTSILLLHGRGSHPDEPNIMNPLRTNLDMTSIYSLQLPVLSKGKTYREYSSIFKYSTNRIQQAINYIVDNNNNDIIIIAHSCGVHMLMDYIEKFSTNYITAVILIGAGAVDKNESMAEPYPYESIKIPVLNIYGENDHGSVLHNALIFNEFTQTTFHKKSEQIKIIGSNHDHIDNQKILLDIVKKWLKSL